MSPGDLTTAVPLPLYAVVAASAADAAAMPINRIRAVAERVPDGEVLGSTVIDVSPTADSWEVSLDVEVPALGVQVIVYLELIHVDDSGIETVEFSGRTSPIPVRAGATAAPVEVEVVRGPADNLAVTAIEISEAPAVLVEGSTAALVASVTTDAPASPTVFWTVLDPTILDVSGGMVLGLGPGTGRVVATAGAYSDTVSISVLPRPDAVAIDQDSAEVSGLGVDVTLTGHVLDPRGDVIPDGELLWRCLNPTIAESLGDGVFRSLSIGEAVVEARAAADTTLKATAFVQVRTVPIDLAVHKSVSTDSAQEGDTVEFTVTVSSLGAQPVDGASVVDDLPAGLTLISTALSAGSFDAPTGTWTLPTLSADSRTATLTLRASVDVGTAGRVLVNEVVVLPAPGQADADPSDDRATASVTILNPTADVSVTKTSDRNVAIEGDTVTFFVVVTNLGPGDAPDLEVLDRLPTGLTYIDLVPDAGTYDEPTGIWSLSLAAGASSRFTARGVANATSVGHTVVNTARAKLGPGMVDPITSNDVADASVEIHAGVPTADVSVTKTVDLPLPGELDLVTFTLSVQNQGPDTATNILVSDVIPAGLTFDSEILGAEVASLGGGQYSVAALAAGATATFDIAAFVDAGTTGSTITNVLHVASLDQNDPDTANDTASVSLTVASGPLDVGITKSVDKGTISEGDTLTFTITAENFGPDTATSLVIWDSLPDPLVFVSATPTAGTVDTTNHTWSIGNLAPGTVDTLTVVARAPDGSGGTTPLNEAHVNSLDQPDADSGNDQASASVTIQTRQLDIEVLKKVDNPVPLELDSVVFTVGAVNHGPGAATNLVLLDTVASSLQFVSAVASHGSLLGDTLWVIGTLPAGDTATIQVTMSVLAGAAGDTIDNVALLAALDQTDNNGANDLATVRIIIPVDNPPTLTLTGPSDASTYDPGDPITFSGTANDIEDGDLTASIQWTSDIDGLIGTGGGFTTSTLSPGRHVITASVTDSQLTTVTDQIGIVIAIVTAPTTLNVPFGGTASLPISLSAPAPAGGLALTVTSADPTVTDPVSASLTIPAGGLSANATLQGILPGTTNVTVTSVDFGSSVTSVSVTAALNVTQNTLTVPRGFPQDFTVRLESQSTPIAAPAGDLSVTLSSADPSCVAVPASITISAGLVSQVATASYGAVTPTPCAAWVRTSAPSIAPDSVLVTIQSTPAVSLSTGMTVGSGLQYGAYQAYLATTLHGGVTVRIESADPAKLLVSANATTAGTAFIDVPVAAGQNRAYYYVHGMEGITADTVPLWASAPGFTPDTADAVVLQPGLDIYGLTTTMTTFSPDDPFQVRIGVPYAGGSGVWLEQSIRIGGSAVTTTVTSSDVGVGDLTMSSSSGGSVTMDIAPGVSRTPSNVAGGGVALNPASGGTTSVTATIPGYVSTTNATKAVTVSAPTITLGAGATVGSGLQYGSYSAYLGATAHGGVTVRIESADPATLLVSANATTAGTAFIDVAVANGQNGAYYYVHGVEGITADTVLLSASALGFTPDTAEVFVVAPGLDIYGLTTTTTTFSPDDPFQVRIGVPYAGGSGLWIEQSIRIGGSAVTTTVTSSDAGVGDLTMSSSSGGSVTMDIAPGVARTPSNVAGGGVAFNPASGGTTSVTATIPGYVSTTNATKAVTVSAPTISMSTGVRVGSGLQYGSHSAYLGATAHGGVTVRIESADPATLLVSPNATTAGTAFIDVAVANGQNRAYYHVHGVEGITADTVLLSASAPGFTPDAEDVIVVQPGLDIYSLATTLTTFSPDDPFQVRIGVPYAGGSGVWIEQAIRMGASAITTTVTSDTTGVGVLKTSSSSGGSLTMDIAPGAARTPFSVATGGMAFDPLGSGVTTVSATAPGVIATTAASRDVTVSSPSITANSATVGAGLQFGNFQAILGAGAHGGVTVRLTSSNPSVFLVSPDASTAGTASIDVVVPDGRNRAYYYVHGMEGALGTATLLVSAPGFTDGSTTVTVVQPALDLYLLSTSQSASGFDDTFQVRIGTTNATHTSVYSEQAIRVGGSPLTATITSSDPSAGQLVTTAVTGSTVTVQIMPGWARSPSTVATGGAAFDPLVAGSTAVSATIPGLIATAYATKAITINP